MKNKKMVSIIAAVFICAAGVLTFSLTVSSGKSKNELLEANTETTTIQDKDVIIETTTEQTTELITETITELTTIPEPTTIKESVIETTTKEIKNVNTKVEKKSENKPKTPAEAVPPKETPTQEQIEKSKETGEEITPQNISNDNSTPKTGDTREDGKVYVDGFGWVDEEYINHEVEVHTAVGMGTGEIVGDM